MALSLLVLLVPIFVLVVGYRVLFNGDAPAKADPKPALESAKRAGMTQLPPETPPAGWSIVTAQFRDGVLRIGYLTDAHKEVQLVESKLDLAATELPKAGETRLFGRGGDTTIVVLTKGADVTPLTKTLPIAVSESSLAQ
jgi:hypothetical protein